MKRTNRRSDPRERLFQSKGYALIPLPLPPQGEGEFGPSPGGRGVGVRALTI